MNYRQQVVAWSLLLALLVGCRDAAQPATLTEPTAAGPQPAAAPRDTAAPNPEALFAEHCARCHTDPENREAMRLTAMARLNPAHVLFTMTNGVMKPQAEGLDFGQMLEIAQFITGAREPWVPEPDAFCAERTPDTHPVIGRWAVTETSSAALPEGVSGIHAGNVNSLRLAWAFGLPDVADARSQPGLTEDSLFLAATSGHLFALDRESGCIRWHSTPPAPPRTALTFGTVRGAAALFYGDMEAHVNAVDALTGAPLWRVDASVSEHTMLTGAQIQHDGRLIVPVSLYEVGLAANPRYECCRSHGAVLALSADSGARLWTTPTTAPATARELTAAGVQSYGPSGVPVWSTPTVDARRGLIYVGTGQNASLPATEYSDSVLALDLETGAVVWHFQAIAGDAYNMACDQRPPGPNCPKWRGPDHDIGAAVVITRDAAGRERLIVGQKSGDVYALDPEDQGRMLWQRRVGAGSALGGVHWGLAVSDGVIYAPVSDPPYPIPNYRPAPGLYALAVDDGGLLWESPVRRGCETNLFEYFGRDTLYPECSFFYGLSAAPLVVNDLVFAPALDGRLRAFAREDGRVAWSAETIRPYRTVNGVEAHGGAMDVAGVQAAGDMLYVQSGYAQFGQLPGNVLLAFTLGE